jgi:hypothetical protein
MAKESGLGLACSVDDSGGTLRAISNDVTNLTFAIPSGVQDITGVNSTGMERLLLLADMTVTLNGVFNDAATTGAHTVLSNYRTLFTSQVGRTTTIAHSGQTLSDEILYSDYALTRAADGSLTFTSPGSLSDGGTPAWA